MSSGTINRRLLHILYLCLGIGAAIGLFYLAARLGIGIPCLFRRFTGFLCPGCGNSRAALALLRFDLAAALDYNLLFPLEFFYIGWVFVNLCIRYLKTGSFSYRSPLPPLDYTVLALVLLWGIARNLPLFVQ